MLDRIATAGIIVVYILSAVTQPDREPVPEIIIDTGGQTIDIMLSPLSRVGKIVVSVHSPGSIERILQPQGQPIGCCVAGIKDSVMADIIFIFSRIAIEIGIQGINKIQSAFGRCRSKLNSRLQEISVNPLFIIFRFIKIAVTLTADRGRRLDIKNWFSRRHHRKYRKKE
jgi:hypothetical protein